MGAAELSIIIQHTSHVTQLLSLGYDNYGDNMVSENIHNTHTQVDTRHSVTATGTRYGELRIYTTHTQVDTRHSVTATGTRYGELRMVIGLLLREGGREERGGERVKYMYIRITSDNHAVTPVQIVGGI